MSFMLDNAGRLIPLGQVHKKKRWEVWNDTALPADWTSDQGVVSFPQPTDTTGQGSCRVSTAGAVADKANIKFATTLDMTSLSGMMFSVEGLSLDAGATISNVDIELGMLGAAGVGCAFTETGAATASSLSSQGLTAPVLSIYKFRDLGRHNVILAMSPISRHLAAWSGSSEHPHRFDEHAYKKAGSMTLGAVTAKFEITARTTAAVRYFQFGAISLEFWY